MSDDRPRPKRPHNHTAQLLGAKILSGELPPGHTLANEEEASVSLSVSRSAYREALRTLAAKGLVYSRPKAGTKVLPRERWNLLDLDVLGWLFSREPDEQLIRDLFGLRLIVEPAAAALAARAWDEAGLTPLRAAMDRMISSENSSETWRQADKEFHNAIMRLAGNAFLSTLSNAISTAVRLTTVYKLRAPEPPRNSTLDHLRIYEAIRARDDLAAARNMRMLVEIALEETLRERERAGC